MSLNVHRDESVEVASCGSEGEERMEGKRNNNDRRRRKTNQHCPEETVRKQDVEDAVRGK